MVFTIPKWNQKEFLKKIHSYQKKGLYIGFKDLGDTYFDYNNTSYLCTKYEVSTDNVYQVPGWKFIGTIEHLDSGNIIRKAVEVEVPERYYTAPCECEHCHTIRKRNDTYLVCDSNGNFKQVGKSCLLAYTGLNPAICAAAMSIEAELQKMEADEEDIRTHGSSYTMFKGFDMLEVKAVTIPIVKKNGYTKAEDAYYSNTSSTKDLMCKAYGAKGAERASAEEIEAIDNWVNSLTPDNEYLRNAITAYKASFIEYRDFALVGSLINYYYMAKAREAAIAAKNAKNAMASESGYIGSVGDKITFTVKDCRVLYEVGSYSYYGPSTVAYEIIDTEGHVIIWKTSQAVQPGDVYKATVKDQKEYKGIPQTVITRGSLISGVGQN